MTIRCLVAACVVVLSAVAGAYEKKVLWKSGDNGVKIYRIPALCTAPNGDLVAACDARTWNGGDLCVYQPINITVRRSTDGGKTWTAPANSWTWDWKENGPRWSGSDPSFVVDAVAKKIFLFYNVWEWEQVEANARAAGDEKGLRARRHGVYRFFVQESSNNGKSWSKPREISKDIAIEGWPCGAEEGKGGFIFITSGSGTQLKDGTLLHTIVHVGDGNALFGSPDHGKTWKPYGKPAKGGDECKVVELTNGDWMINSRCGGRKRLIHVSKDKGETWTSHHDTTLVDPGCNAQILRVGKALLFSNCNASGRRNLYLRASIDDGQTWSEGLSIEPQGAAYSDITLLKDGKTVGCLYEGAGYATINFVTIPLADVKAQFK